MYERKREQELKKEIAAKDKEIERLQAEYSAESAEFHRIKKRISVVEHAIKMRIILGIPIGSPDIYEEYKASAMEYKGELSKLHNIASLPTTGIDPIDWTFDYFSIEAAKRNIDFDLRVNGDIHTIAESVIDRAKLETIIGDHIQNAIIAIDSGDNAFRGILVTLGINSDYYELTISDSGIEFDIDVLMKLGTERITSHADTGGSGIGLMTTFDIMRECGASLVIDEKEPDRSDFRKSVTVRFDGKSQYIVKTYRANLFPPHERKGIKIVDR